MTWETERDLRKVHTPEAEYDTVIAEYTKALEQDPYDESIYMSRGRLYAAKKQYDQALADYTAAIGINHGYTLAYFYLGELYTVQKEYNKAIMAYTDAIHGNPHGAVFRHVRGSAYFAYAGGLYGENPEALRDWQALREEYGSHRSGCQRQSKALDGIKSHHIHHGIYNLYTHAIEDYTKALELDPQYVSAYLHRGLAYTARYNWYDFCLEAIADYTKVIELDPAQTAVYRYRGNAYFDAGASIPGVMNSVQDEYVHQTLPQWLKQAITEYKKQVLESESLLLKFYDEAIRDYTKSIELDPQYAYAYHMRGYVYFERGDYQKARGDFTKALELNPNNPKTRALLQSAASKQA